MTKLERISRIFLFIAIALLALANVACIGYGLYLWGGLGMAFGAAAWTGFKLWMGMIGIGIVTAGLAFLFEELAYIKERK